MANQFSTWQSPGEMEIGAEIRGFLPDNGPLKFVIVKFLGMTVTGDYMYRIELQENKEYNGQAKQTSTTDTTNYPSDDTSATK